MVEANERFQDPRAGECQTLTTLVVGEDAGSKLDKAEKLNTGQTVLFEEEFLKMNRNPNNDGPTLPDFFNLKHNSALCCRPQR